MEKNTGTRLITIIIIAVALISALVLIIILDGAERSAIAAAVNDTSVLNPVVGNMEPTYEHDDFLKTTAIYQKENNKVICYIQNTSNKDCSANYVVSYKDENNHEIANAKGTISEILAGDYRFAIIDKDIPANVAKIELYAKAGEMTTSPFKVQMQSSVENGNVKISIPAYSVGFSIKEVQVCFMNNNNQIVDVQIYPLSGDIPASMSYSLGELPMGNATRVSVGTYGYVKEQ